MATTVLYNGIDVANGLGPTPLVSKEDNMLRFGERVAQVSTITLFGQVTGNCPTFAALIANQNTLLTRFNKDYQTLQIKDGSSIVFQKPHAVIRNINFPSTNYAFGFDYEVVLDCWPAEYFSGVVGILDPSDEFSYNENDNSSVDMTHTVSCKGLNTDATASNALSNARTWVADRTGLNSQILPKFVPSANATIGCLYSLSESIDRFNGTYSVTENYRYDPNDAGVGLLRYTSQFQSGTDGIATVEVRGTINGCKTSDINTLRTRYSGINPFLIAQEQYTASTNTTGLQAQYVTSGVEENPVIKFLSFNVLYTDDIQPATFFDYRVNAETDYLSDITSVSLNGTVRGRGQLRDRWQRVKEHYSGLNVFSLITGTYSGMGIPYNLNPKPISSGISFNSFVAEIGVNVRLDDEITAPSGLDRWSYDVTISPSMRQYATEPLLENADNNPSGYAFFDLGYTKRATIDVRSNAVIAGDHTSESGVLIIRSQLNTIKNTFVTGSRILLTLNNESRSNRSNNKVVNYQAAWSEDENEFTIP